MPPQIYSSSSRSQCDNCRATYNNEQLEEVEDFFQRVEAGGVVPSGQCPDPACGALCYPYTSGQKRKTAKKSKKKSRSKR